MVSRVVFRARNVAGLPRHGIPEAAQYTPCSPNADSIQSVDESCKSHPNKHSVSEPRKHLYQLQTEMGATEHVPSCSSSGMTTTFTGAPPHSLPTNHWGRSTCPLRGSPALNTHYVKAEIPTAQHTSFLCLRSPKGIRNGCEH